MPRTFTKGKRSMASTQEKVAPQVRQVTLTVRQDKARGTMSEEIAKDRVFLGKVEAALLEAGLFGSYMLDASTMVKGSPHRQGFHLGLPRANRYSIELLWQPRGNDQCYSVALIVPRSVDLFQFHKRLDDAMKAIDEREDEETRRAKMPPQGAASTPTSSAPTNAEDIQPTVEAFLRNIMKSATTAGVVSASACIDVLSAVYKCRDPQSFMIKLVQDGYLVSHNGSDSFLRIAKEWLELFEDTPVDASTAAPVADPLLDRVPIDHPADSVVVPFPQEPVVERVQLAAAPVVAAILPTTEPAQSTEVSAASFLRQITQWKRIAAEAAQNRARGIELDARIDGHRALIAEEQRKLELALNERVKVNAALAGPDVVDAERILAELANEIAK